MRFDPVFVFLKSWKIQLEENNVKRLILMKRNVMIALSAMVVSGLTCITNAEVHVVTQMGLQFDPAEITVAPGDTVQWNWMSGSHTVTSGSDCTFDEIHFDEPLNSANPTATYEIPATFTGVIDYFCRPHCTLEMTGVINVVGDDCPGDLTGDNQVNIDDIFAILGLWGDCPDPCPPFCEGDLTEDCTVNIDDIFAILGLWGPC